MWRWVSGGQEEGGGSMGVTEGQGNLEEISIGAGSSGIWPWCLGRDRGLTLTWSSTTRGPLTLHTVL